MNMHCLNYLNSGASENLNCRLSTEFCRLFTIFFRPAFHLRAVLGYVPLMCNAYNVGRNVKVLQVGEMLRAVAAEEERRETSLIRRTDSAPVITASLGLVTMRWGFEPGRLGTINNSREDKLGGAMWAAAFR